MVFGRWSDSRYFLYLSVSLDLPQYETVQFVPPPPEVGKPGSSDLMLHEAIYHGLIVCFTLLEEVFPSLVCARAKFELSNHSVSLSTQAHMRVLESTLTRVVEHRAHRHLVFYLPSVQLYRSFATFQTGWCTLSHLVSVDNTTVSFSPSPYLLLHLFKTRVKRLLLFCLGDRPWEVPHCYMFQFVLSSA